MIFGTSKEQPWNQYGKLNTKKREMQELAPMAVDNENADDTEKSNFIRER